MSNKNKKENYTTHKSLIHKNKDKIVLPLMFLCIISLITIIPLSLLKVNVFNEQTYHKLYEKNGVDQRFDNETLKNQTTNVIQQIEGKKDLAPGFFSENEISHLKDVKNLIKKGVTLYYVLLTIIISTLLILYFYNYESYLKNTGLIFLMSGAGFMILALILFAFSFSNLFLGFHEAFFPQGNYLFDAQTSNLLKMFPEAFFQDFFNLILTYSLVQAVSYIIIGLIFLHYHKKDNKR